MPVGKISEFNPSTDDFESWIGVMTNYLIANDIDTTREDAAMKKKALAILLSSIGVSTYGLLQSLVSPAKPEDKTLGELIEVLKNHYKPAPKAIAERYKFYKRVQQPGESINLYLSELRKIGVTCKFTDLNTSLRDQLVVGIRSETAQKRLFLEDDGLTLDNAVKIAISQEAADTSTQMIRYNGGATTIVNQTNKVKESSAKQSPSSNKNFNKSKQNSSTCSGCGGKHSKKDCPHKDVICHRCNKSGHFARRCLSKPKSEGGEGKNKISHIKCVKQVSHDSPIMINVRLNGIPTDLELDTASSTSFITPKIWERLGCPKLRISNKSFKTYTGQSFKSKGTFLGNIEYNGQTAQHEIHVSEGSCLFGRDLLRQIQVDWTAIKKQCSRVHRITNELSLNTLLKEYNDVFDQPVGVIRDFKAKLLLKEDAIPRFFKPRSIPFALRDKVDKELDKMEKSGVISRVETSEWASPLVVVPKPNGSVRITGDFKRTINNQLHVNQYPLPKNEELFEKISSGQTFTKLDGPDAFHQVEMEESCKKYLVINTHRGLYRYNVLPQGIASSPAIFQELMDKMLKGIPMTGSFVDDTISTGKNDHDHLYNLKKIFQRMREWNFRLSRKKCIFIQPVVKFLGHILCAEGIRADPGKVESIMSMKEPNNVKEVKSFLGLVNFYNKFINNLSHLCEPLNRLTRDGVDWRWDSKCKGSFDRIKKAISSAPILAHHQQSIPIGISCDASSVGIGVVLFHRYEDRSERPIAFASKTLSSAERNYSQIEKEALSIIFGIKRFTQYLYGRRFILITDHNPLLTIFGPNRELPSLAATRLQRWAIFLSSFLYDIEYRNTCSHGNADALSRLPLEDNQPVDTIVEEEVKTITEEHLITSCAVKEKTCRDPTLSSVIHFIRKGWPSKRSQVPEKLKPYHNHREELTVEQGIVMWGIRVIIPESLRGNILKQLHETHPGIVRMKSLARSYVWWPGIDNDINSLVKSCTTCAVNRDNPATAPLHPWSFPERAWQRLHIDLAGPFLNTMWLIIVDAYSKWPEIYNLGRDTSSNNVIQFLRESIARYGIPDTMVSDNGPQFVSREFEEFCKRNGIRHVKSSAYHPRSNGEAERFVRTFKNSMRSNKATQKNNLELYNFLFNYRITAHATTGVSPSELMMKRKLKCQLDLLHPDVDSTVKTNQEKQRLQFNKNGPIREFSPGDKVWIQTFGKNDSKWSFGIVVRSIGPVSYIVKVEDRTMKRHVDHIISATVQEPSDTSSDEIIINPEGLSNPAEPEISEEPNLGPSSSTETSVRSPRPKRNTRPPDRLHYASFK